MTQVTRWWWIRHAPVTEDGGRIYGQTDVVCDVSDHAALAALAASLPTKATWVASHLQRTYLTARALRDAGAEAPDPIIEPALAEQDFGDWQGQVRAEIYARNPDWRRFWLAPARMAPPRGESFVDVIARVDPAIRRFTREHAGGDIVAVAHGGTIRAALAIALKLDPDVALAFSCDNLSLTRIDHIARPDGEAWRIAAVNVPPLQDARRG